MLTTTNFYLNRIQTNWTLVNQAHEDDGSQTGESRHHLLDRYSGAAWRYLRTIARDEDLAQELFQEFALRLMRGDFRRAQPVRGRFRDYLKAVLINLVKDHHRQQGSRPFALVDDVAERERELDDTHDPFLASWRSELLARAWARLQESRPTLHAVLRAHVRDPEATADAKAGQVGSELSTDFSANRFRVTLHRARQKFATLLRLEIEESLENSSEEEFDRELVQLRLRRYCAVA